MVDLKKLEINKLIREFKYVKSDYEYKSEIIKDDSQFLNNVDRILDKNTELKVMYNVKIHKNDTISTEDIYFEEVNNIRSKECDSEDSTKESIDEENIKSDKIKKLFRKIAKITHPDKISHMGLNSVYMEASKFYEENDIMEIYRICEDLHIDYEIDLSDIDYIKNSILTLKEKIKFIERNYIWIWHNEEESKRDKMVLDYIRKQLIS